MQKFPLRRNEASKEIDHHQAAPLQALSTLTGMDALHLVLSEQDTHYFEHAVSPGHAVLPDGLGSHVCFDSNPHKCARDLHWSVALWLLIFAPTST